MSDLKKAKKIYLYSDREGWIRTVKKRMHGLCCMLDVYHLQKCLTKLTSHMKDSTDDALRELGE